MTNTHAHQVRAFQQSETRFVFARLRTPRPGASAEAYFLADGRDIDKTFRQWVLDSLMCPARDCGDPRLRVVLRHPRARDGFAHFKGHGGHGPESISHFNAKHLVARWVEAQHPWAKVTVEAVLESGARIADVLIEWSTGERSAIEVQYADLQPAMWRERHDWYVTNNIQDTWLLGHTYPSLQVSPDGKMAPTPLQAQIMKAGGHLLWINPDTDTIGTATGTDTPYTVTDRLGAAIEWPDGLTGHAFKVPAASHHKDLRLDIDALADCRLTPTGFVTPTLQAAISEQARLDNVNRLRRLDEDRLRAIAEAQHGEAIRRAEEQERLDAEHRARLERLRAEPGAARDRYALITAAVFPTVHSPAPWHRALAFRLTNNPDTPPLPVLRAEMGPVLLRGVSDEDLLAALASARLKRTPRL